MDPCQRLAQTLQSAIDANGGVLPLPAIFEIVQAGIGCTVTNVQTVGGVLVLQTPQGEIKIEDDDDSMTVVRTDQATAAFPWAKVIAALVAYKVVFG